MKLPLGIALALHVLVLGAGGRWARTRHAAAPGSAPGAMEGIVVDAPPLPPEPDEAPPPPARPAAAKSPGGTGRRPAAHRPAPGRPGVRSQQAVEAPLGAIDAWVRAQRAREAPAVGEPEASGGTGRGRGAVLGTGGDGDGGAGAGAARGRRRAGEMWDSVGPGSGEPRPHALEADESTLPRHVVEGAVGRSAGRLRFCYQDGLRREPGLAGRIPVRFAVAPGGSVVVASDGGSTVADPAVVRCVLSTFAAMTFPPRASGDAVWTTYVVAFPPG